MTVISEEVLRIEIEEIEHDNKTQVIGHVLGCLEERITALEADMYRVLQKLERLEERGYFK